MTDIEQKAKEYANSVFGITTQRLEESENNFLKGAHQEVEFHFLAGASAKQKEIVEKLKLWVDYSDKAGYNQAKVMLDDIIWELEQEKK